MNVLSVPECYCVLHVSVLLLIKKLLLIGLRNITFATGEMNVQEAHSLDQIYTETMAVFFCGIKQRIINVTM